MDKNYFEELNGLFKKFQEIGIDYSSNIGNLVTNLNIDDRRILTNKIPVKLKEFFPESEYQIKGSVGQTNIARCPWVSIMNKKETTSTQRGVYLVFLFSSDLKSIYFQLGFGVTDLKSHQIPTLRDKIRKKLNLENNYFKHFNKHNISHDGYKECAIYAHEWDCNDNNLSKILLEEYKKIYEFYIELKTKENQDIDIDIKATKINVPVVSDSGKEMLPFSITNVIEKIQSTGLIYSDELIKRLAYSLMAKPFVILSGLAGSGKTQLALAFAKCLSEDIEEQICTVSVGADWTNREPLLGYPNALKSGEYVMPESGVLQLLMRAVEHPDKPYFLILDEMNMSVVERYFADFLSAMESGEDIKLWDGSGDVPAEMSLPKNVFIIGTINVDETTYMFSPKVLDRANVIEFKISQEEMSEYLGKTVNINPKAAYSACADMAVDFVKEAKSQVVKDETHQNILLSFFKELKKVNAEFGYRTVNEISRYLHFAKDMDGNAAIDTAILQKLLPKLHGSRKKLVPVLTTMWGLCLNDGKDIDIEAEFNREDFKYPESAEKIQRMYNAVVDNGFTSFAEA